MSLKVLLVVGNPSSLSTNDSWINSRLTTQGHTVTTIDDTAAAPSSYAAYNLVLMSNSCNNAQLSTKYDAATVGVFSIHTTIFAHSKFNAVAASSGTSVTTFFGIAPNSDPIVPNTNGLTVTFRTSADVYAYMTNTNLGSGAVQMLAARNNLLTRIVAARYEAGAALSDGSAAPSRRIMVDLLDVTALDATGISWFDNAVQWAKTNAAPTASAGPDQTVNAAQVVTLDGTGSSDDGSISVYTWRQISGPTVTLSSTSVAQPTFTSPSDITGTSLTFGLIVTDDSALQSAEDTVTITVRSSATVNARVGGVWVAKPIKSRVNGGWVN